MITTKRQTYDLYTSGAFGNKGLLWNTQAELLSSGYTGLVVIRYKEPGSSFCRYDCPFDRVSDVVSYFNQQGANEELMVFQPATDDTKLLIQGEVTRSENYLTLYYSTEKVKMRDALRSSGQQVEGIRALMILKHFLTPSSYEDLWMLLEKYEDAVVEFSTWESCVGDLEGRNTIVWEVRNY